MLETGTEIAGYRIDGVVGTGGMGVVYEATQLSLDRTVALKVLTPSLGADTEFRERFRREAMLQAALEHPCIVPVYEAGESDDGLFIAMRLVRGSDLKQLIEQGLEPERALGLLGQAAAALDAAHEAGLVHRDVKPQNVLVEDGDRAFLADFGLTKGAGDRSVTLAGQYLGSLDYAAPEQIRGETFGPAGDLYALAAVLYEALTGEVPYPHETEAALLYAHLSEEPPRPSERRPELPSGLDAVVARGLAKRPEERYRTAGELVADARRALASPPAAAEPGERRRFGETIVDPTVLRSAPVVELESERVVPWRPLGIAAVVVLALAAAAFAVGRATGGSKPSERGVAAAGPLSLSFPSGSWRPAPAPAIEGLPLEGAVALASTHRDRPGTIVAGIAPGAEGPGLLPAGLRAQLAGTATGDPVSVGRAAGIRYRALPALRIPSRLDLLLVPTPRGAAAVACLTPRVLPSGTKPADCAAVAATLRLHGLRALPLGQTGPYARSAAATLARLDGERLAGRRQLEGAARAGEQARAASGLASSFASAAAALARLAPTPTARPAHDALVASLRAVARRYAALAAAAASRSGYDAAARRIDASERRVDAAIRRLESL